MKATNQMGYIKKKQEHFGIRDLVFSRVNRPGCEERYNWKEPRVLSRLLDHPHHGNDNFSMTASRMRSRLNPAGNS